MLIYIFGIHCCCSWLRSMFCRLLQSDLHSGRRPGERDEVPSCHEPTQSHWPRTRHGVDGSLRGQRGECAHVHHPPHALVASFRPHANMLSAPSCSLVLAVAHCSDTLPIVHTSQRIQLNSNEVLVALTVSSRVIFFTVRLVQHVRLCCPLILIVATLPPHAAGLITYYELH